MASGIHNRWKCDVMKKLVNMHTGGDSIICDLFETGYTFNPDLSVYGDLAGAGGTEITGAGYPNGDTNILQTQAVTQDDTDNEGMFDAANMVWTAASFSAYFAILWDDTHASDILICSIDFGGVKTVTAGTFTIDWALEGIINIT